MDTGVQPDHPALRGHLLPGHDFVNGTSTAADDNGHGTALAGIVAATCPRCEILPVKVLDQYATGDYATIAAGVVWAADHGADVINLSVGGPRPMDALGQAIAYAESKGAVVVAAAGNNGQTTPFFPADYPGVVSVAGVDANGARYSWSNFGSWVSVAAPGCAATASLGGGVTSNFCGTSTAAPFVAGVAGLARAYRPSLGPAAIVSAIEGSTAALPDAGVAAHGYVDANRLLIALGAPAATPSAAASPAIPDAPVVGRRVVATPGRWLAAKRISVQWQGSRNGRSWHTLGRLLAFTPSRREAGSRLRLVVTAVNARGKTVHRSAATAPVRSSNQLS